VAPPGFPLIPACVALAGLGVCWAANPGRRCAAVAAALCAGLVCGGLSGRTRSTTSSMASRPVPHGGGPTPAVCRGNSPSLWNCSTGPGGSFSRGSEAASSMPQGTPMICGTGDGVHPLCPPPQCCVDQRGAAGTGQGVAGSSVMLTPVRRNTRARCCASLVARAFGRSDQDFRRNRRTDVVLFAADAAIRRIFFPRRAQIWKFAGRLIWTGRWAPAIIRNVYKRLVFASAAIGNVIGRFPRGMRRDAVCGRWDTVADASGSQAFQT
jgi:hypothetical protein